MSSQTDHFGINAMHWGDDKMVKNTLKTLLILIIIVLWLPTGPSDIFIIPFLIGLLGFELYALISVLLIVYLYKSIKGKTLGEKMDNTFKGIKILFKGGK